MSTLSDRLRGLHGHSLPLNTLLDEAADELDRLTEEAADRYKSWCEMHSSFERGRDEIERLTARVAELKGALKFATERARADALEAALQSALPIVEEYARKNPTWTNGIGPTQDPMGAHALAAAARALLEKKT